MIIYILLLWFFICFESCDCKRVLAEKSRMSKIRLCGSWCSYICIYLNFARMKTSSLLFLIYLLVASLIGVFLSLNSIPKVTLPFMNKSSRRMTDKRFFYNQFCAFSFTSWINGQNQKFSKYFKIFLFNKEGKHFCPKFVRNWFVEIN